MSGRTRLACVAAATLLTTGAATADDYPAPSDFSVTCLDAATGAARWSATPPSLSSPTLRIVDGRLVVEEPSRSPAPPHVFELTTGTPSPRPLPAAAAPTRDQLPAQGLTTAGGLTLVYRPGSTHDLATRDRVLLSLDYFIDGLAVTGDLAVFTYAAGVTDRGLGEVYAYDLATGRLAWEFDAHTVLPGLPAAGYTGVWADAQAVIVSVDQHLIALDPASGQVAWQTALPRQAVRRYDGPWTRIARDGDRLYAQVYEDLFAVRASDGAVLWQFDAGPHARPWPLVAGGLACVERRTGAVPPVGYTATATPAARPAPVTAITIQRRRGKITLGPIARSAIPAGVTTWSSLNRPAGAGRGQRKITLQLRGGLTPVELDLSTALAKDGVAYVSVSPGPTVAEVRVGGRRRATLWMRRP